MVARERPLGSLQKRPAAVQTLRSPAVVRATDAHGTQAATPQRTRWHSCNSRDVPGFIGRPRSRYLLYAASFALPAVLVLSALRTFSELETLREVYLRQRAAGIAAQLESVEAQNRPLAETVASLAEEESHLVDLRVFSPDSSNRPANLEPLWSGAELFRTQFVQGNGRRLYRAHVPFHAGEAVNIAQIDLDAAAGDFLATHGRHNVYFSAAVGAVLIVLSLYAVWAAGRAAALERRHLELQHLAHLGTMSAVLAHEIRNPLGTIKGFAQLAIEQAGEEDRGMLTPILEQSQRLENLTNDLLVYGRPPAPSRRAVQWPELAARIAEHGRRLAGSRTAVLSVEPSEFEFTTDPDLLEQILVNLVRNALDAVGSEPGGEVRLEARRADGQVEFSVRDNGPGIPEALHAKVREPFYTTKAFGTGLGLPISFRLAESLGGTLELRSAGVSGTVAVVRLPAAL